MGARGGDGRFVRFVYGPGYVTANVGPVTLCDGPGVRCVARSLFRKSMSDVLGATEPAATLKASAKSASRQPAHAKAWKADGFSDDCERALAAGVAIGRLMGASEVTLKKSTYEMTVTLKDNYDEKIRC